MSATKNTITKLSLHDYGYGKSNIKLLYVNKTNPRHETSEYEISVSLKLNNTNDHTTECNKSVIATDSQKNTVYILAKKYGIQNPEEFAIRLCTHFLSTYPQIVKVSIKVVQIQWNRININSSEHNHAFWFNGENTSTSSEVRFAEITKEQNGPLIVRGGIKGLSLLKTTQSGFTGFVTDEYRSLPDSSDRIFRTIVSARWEYCQKLLSNNLIDFDLIYNQVKRIVVETFAGHHETGEYSPSVQRNLYKTVEQVMTQIKEIKEISLNMPNIHYFDFDFEKFGTVVNKTDLNNGIYVYVPQDNPNGVMFVTLKRNNDQIVSKL